MTAQLTALPIALPDGTVPNTRLTVIEVPGIGLEAGRVYGAACRPLIEQHLREALARLEARGVTREEAFRRALPYREATRAALPDLAAEVDGVAEGAGLPLAAAWVLQLRAELARPEERVGEHECTSFGVFGAATTDGSVYAGQNADLPELYSSLLVLVRRDPPGGPRVMTLTPAGQIGYHGMNDAGVSVFANFLHSDGWRVGVPRYLYTRVALAERTRADALAAVERLERASPRNLMVADDTGVTDLETTTTSSERIEAEDGLVAHSNHYLAPSLVEREESKGRGLENSRRRLARMQSLLRKHHGALDPNTIATVLRDRDAAPDALCRASGEWDDDVMTIASTFAETRARRLWITISPPNLSAYHAYEV